MQTRIDIRIVSLLTVSFALACSALPLVGSPDASAISFESGDLFSTEKSSLSVLDPACRQAIEILGYDSVETTREVDRVRWQAQTAGRAPVEIELNAKGRGRTELRIRIGAFGDEAHSRLVLEQIHQSL